MRKRLSVCFLTLSLISLIFTSCTSSNQSSNDYNSTSSYVYSDTSSSTVSSGSANSQNVKSNVVNSKISSSSSKVTRASSKVNSTQNASKKETPQIKQNTDKPQSVTVYITRTGKKYHRAGCRYLSRSQISISLDEAKSEGYTACSICCPPQ
jgi:hypothetical protein